MLPGEYPVTYAPALDGVGAATLTAHENTGGAVWQVCAGFAGNGRSFRSQGLSRDATYSLLSHTPPTPPACMATPSGPRRNKANRMRANRANAMERAPVQPHQDVARVLRRDGFTLIEVLIVVAIMAVLAGTIISYSPSGADSAKKSSLEHNLYIIRLQVQLYQANHLGQYPSLAGNTLPQLMTATDSNGNAGPSGPDYPYGPYFTGPPINPYDGSSHIAAVLTPGQQPTAVADSLGGWQYDQSNGSVWPNNPECYGNP